MKLKEWKGHKSNVVEVIVSDNEPLSEVIFFVEEQGYQVCPSAEDGVGVSNHNGSYSWFIPIFK